MEKDYKINPNIIIKVANKEDLTELTICAIEFIQLIENFKFNFLDGKYLTLIIYYNNIVAGVLVAEEQSRKVDSIENFLPKTALKLIYINPKFRNNLLGTKLLISFLKSQKEKGIASVFIKLPQRYKIGIDFFEKNNFYRVGKVRDFLLLEFNLWSDFGLRFSEFLPDDFNNFFD